jgi:hypothetical protein
MITYGYAKAYKYAGDGTLSVKVRIPSVHGPYKQSNAKGKTIKNYVLDNDLPWYSSLLLPHLPQEGEVVAIASLDKGNNDFIVIGLTGGSYNAGATNVGG